MIAPSKTFNLAGLATSVNIIPDRKMREAFIRTMSGLVIGGMSWVILPWKRPILGEMNGWKAS